MQMSVDGALESKDGRTVLPGNFALSSTCAN
jgi:hypothetical protein